MASYIPNITDNTQQIPVAATMPQSNYQFLQTQMDKANAMYESGLQEVKSGYASIVNAPVTGIEANERKQKYIQQAQNKLRTLSSKDLSLPQNVAQAETAYAPFWEDDLLVTNSAYTRKIGKENSQLDSWLYSTDEETRRLYSDHNRQALQKVSGILAGTPMTKEAYNRLSLEMQEARAIPYYDIDKEIEESWKNTYGVGVDKGVGYTVTNGAGMMTAYNGPKSFDAYKTWYISQLGEKYAPQLRQQAWVETQNRREQIMAENPTITDPKQVDRLLAKDRMREIQEAYMSNINSYSNLISDYDKRINDLNIHKAAQGGNLSPSEQMEYDYLSAQMQGYIALKSELETETNSNYTEVIDGKANPNYFKTLTDIADNPVGYISKIKVNEMASTWAKGRSSITGPPKIEVNPIVEKERQWLKEDRDFSISQANLRIETAKLQLKAQELDDNLLIHAGIKNRFTGERDPRFGSKGWMGGTDNTTGLPVGLDANIADETTQVDHLQKYIKVQQDLQRPLDEAINETLDIKNPTGFGTTVLGDHGVGLNDAEMNHFSNYMKKLYKDDKTTPNEKEKIALDKVVSAMLKEGTISSSSSIKGAISLQNALAEYGNKKVATGLADLKADEAQTVRIQFARHRDNIKQLTSQYLGGKEKFDKEVLEKASKDDRFNKLLVEDEDDNGKKIKRIVEPRDIEKILPKDIYAVDENGEQIKFDKKLFAQNYLANNVKDYVNLKGEKVIEMEGIKYIIPYIPFNTKAEKNFNDFGKSIWAIYNKHGNPKDINTLRSRLVGELSGSVKYDKGILYKGLNLDPNDADTDKAEFTRGKIKQLAPIGNTTRFHIYENGSNTPTYLTNMKNGASTVEQIRGVLSSDDEQKKWIANVDFVREAGKVGITFKKDLTKSEDKQPVFAGKTVWVESTPTMKQQLMSWIPNTTISGPLITVAEGATYTSPTSLSTDGYEGTITPIEEGPDGKPTAVVVNVKYKDPKTNTIKRSRDVGYLVGPNANSMTEIWNKYQNFLNMITTNQQIASRVSSQEIAASSPAK